jgi:hypothetical protein
MDWCTADLPTGCQDDVLGYVPETVMPLHLVPLVQMAWADGGVSDLERALIVEAARARGNRPGLAGGSPTGDVARDRGIGGATSGPSAGRSPAAYVLRA